MTLTWVETGLPPQLTIRSDFAISRPSMPRFGRPAVVMRPYRFSAVALRGARQSFGNFVESVLPGDRHKGRRSDALLANPTHWL
jgi:hypothetical protein